MEPGESGDRNGAEKSDRRIRRFAPNGERSASRRQHADLQIFINRGGVKMPHL